MITCDKCDFCSKTQGGSLYCAWTDPFVPNIGCENGKPKTKPQTNADRIRQMSDDELADWLVMNGNGEDYRGWLEWLKEEATE